MVLLSFYRAANYKQRCVYLPTVDDYASTAAYCHSVTSSFSNLVRYSSATVEALNKASKSVYCCTNLISVKVYSSRQLLQTWFEV